MSRMLLLWSLLFGLALAGADWYTGRGQTAGTAPSEGGVTATEDGTPIPPPK